MIRRPPRSTPLYSSAARDVYKRQVITPHWTSAMAAFGYVAGFYLCLLILEVWFAFRADIVAMSKVRSGIMGKVDVWLSLGADDGAARALAIDHKVARIWSMIGMPAACGLHGYV